jgi:hypothetical protein
LSKILQNLQARLVREQNLYARATTRGERELRKVHMVQITKEIMHLVYGDGGEIVVKVSH